MITFLKTQGEILVGQEESITVVLKTLAIWDMSNSLHSSVFSRCFSTDKYFFFCNEKYFTLRTGCTLMGMGNSSLSKGKWCLVQESPKARPSLTITSSVTCAILLLAFCSHFLA